MLKYIELLRPKQWVKNLVVLAGPTFALKLFQYEAFLATAVFCMVASASYALNDVLDRKADREHPTKQHRPVASGAVPPGAAVGLSLVLVLLASLLCWIFLPVTVLGLVLGYFALIIAYSAALKRRPILDVIIIAVGFVIRAVAGAAAVEAVVSPWLMVCTFTLCLFLGFGKRRCELATFTSAGAAQAHRPTLVRYTPELLNQLTSVSAGIAIVTFLLYTMDTNPKFYPEFAKEYLIYTLPLVAYALFRYAMLIESGKFVGPTEIILQDKGVLLTGLLWMAVVGAIVWQTKGTTPPSAPPVVQQAPLEGLPSD